MSVAMDLYMRLMARVLIPSRWGENRQRGSLKIRCEASGGSVGIGFAVPIDTARRVLPELLTTGEVRRGWIDVRPVQLTPRLARDLSAPVASGLLVSEAIRGGNADAAGLRGGSRAVRLGRSVFRIGGDIIVEVDGVPVSNIADLFSSLEDNKPGETVQVVYFRGGSRRTASITLSERSPQISPLPTSPLSCSLPSSPGRKTCSRP